MRHIRVTGYAPLVRPTESKPFGNLMKKPRIVIAATLFLTALICARLSSAPPNSQSNQQAEEDCLNAYNVCYGNCKGKADACYSNCDTAYRHCMHGAGVDFAPLKKHPHQPPQAVAPNKGAASPSPSPRKGPGKVGTTGMSHPSPSPSPSATHPVLLDKKGTTSPTPTPKKK